jgi:O-antigen/teichoic acid export membrane protein
MRTAGKTLLSNSAWSLLNQIARVGALALVTIALSRHFGPQRFGSLAFGLAFVRIFAVIAAFGLDRVLVRHFVDAEGVSGATLRSAFGLKLGIALLSYAALVAIVFVTDPHDRLTLSIVLLAGAGLIFQAFDVFDFFFQSQNRFRLTFFGRTLPIVLSTAIKIGAIAAGAPLLVFAALETVETALIALALFVVYRHCRTAPLAHDHARPRAARLLLREGFPLLLGSLAAMIYMRSDILMLGKMAGFKAAGIYTAASQITEACALFPMAFVPALFPILLRWRKLGAEFYEQQFEKLFLGAALAGASMAAGLTIAAPLIVRLLYGPAYSSAANILVIHAWSAIFLYTAILQTGYEFTERLTWMTALRTAAGATVNIILNFAFIPRYGASGSALATLLALSCSGFLFNVVHRSTRPIFWMQLRAFLLLPLFRSRSRNPIRIETESRDTFPLPRPSWCELPKT